MAQPNMEQGDNVINFPSAWIPNEVANPADPSIISREDFEAPHYPPLGVHSYLRNTTSGIINEPVEPMTVTQFANLTTAPIADELNGLTATVPHGNAAHLQELPHASIDVLTEEERKDNRELRHTVAGRVADYRIEILDRSIPTAPEVALNSHEYWSLIRGDLTNGKIPLSAFVTECYRQGRYTPYAGKGGQTPLDSIIGGAIVDNPARMPHEYREQGHPFDKMGPLRVTGLWTSADPTPWDFLVIRRKPESRSEVEAYWVSTELAQKEEELVQEFGGSIEAITDVVEQAAIGWRKMIEQMGSGETSLNFQALVEEGVNIGYQHSFNAGKLIRVFDQRYANGILRPFTYRTVFRLVDQLVDLEEAEKRIKGMHGYVNPEDDSNMKRRKRNVILEFIQGMAMIAARKQIRDIARQSRDPDPIRLEVSGFSSRDHLFFSLLKNIDPKTDNGLANYWYQRYGTPENAKLLFEVGAPIGNNGEPTSNNVFVTKEGLYLDPDTTPDAFKNPDDSFRRKLRYGVGKGMTYVSPGDFPIDSKNSLLRPGSPLTNPGFIGGVVVKTELNCVYPSYYFDIKEARAPAITWMLEHGILLGDATLPYNPVMSDFYRPSLNPAYIMYRFGREVIEPRGVYNIRDTVGDGSGPTGEAFAIVRSTDNTTVDLTDDVRVTTEHDAYLAAHGVTSEEELDESQRLSKDERDLAQNTFELTPEMKGTEQLIARAAIVNGLPYFDYTTNTLGTSKTVIMPSENPRDREQLRKGTKR